MDSPVKTKTLKSVATQYAVVDIETTGGSVSNSRITEVAVILHDGQRVTKRWSSLVNPEMPIPLHITALTGIDEEMVATAPTFAEIAEQLIELLADKVFVAHNVNFDYSFLRGQLAACGIQWNATKLCTVRLSRKLLSGLPSYSLGKLCAAVGIELKDRHRALGDAEATAHLFTLLLEKDEQQLIREMVLKASPEQRLPANVPLADFKALPDSPGVYYFHNKIGKVIYVGKAVNIKKRVASHFTGNDSGARRQHFLKDIFHISFEKCGSELMALLLECTEIQRLWPQHNRALKRFEAKFALYHYVAVNGYSYLAVGRLTKQQPHVKTFDREIDGLNFLAEITNKFQIDQRFCRYGKASVLRSDENLPSVESHNAAVNSLLEDILTEQPSFVIIEDGRSNDELGCVYVEKGNFCGMGYLTSDVSFSSYQEVKEHITTYKGNHYMLQLVMSYAQRYPSRIKWLG
ncbi:exonuclease domain-containing protein [Nubsella zeaxanthinifaciens]|uniref:exonuclease domain-containing protein n=1 Tax=Nubsella zeaxanthinifaciens TaxID=392412 RepID=UPI000DE24178|nr:exonuclease domain-containing protein [Nubsella zeaxanthinifaciens]